jgi:Mg/Co/Ni transporter MgtE
MGLHILMGIGFAFVYYGFLTLSSLPFNALTGLLLGSIHGVIAMLIVSILIMEHHPNSKYHNRGPATGLAQLGAHMVYGTVVGSVASLLR